ncbi:helix-turn-helix domain-containing protein [Panacagrimonas sp.]|uniref:helix-turn-helix domain-containing protein n=1 Tax=Panacagrimonas sp. TaxID=2480088 RepID=UPI003B529CD4
MQPSSPPITASPPGRFAASGRAIVRSVGFAPELSSESAGWNSLALYAWRGQCQEAAFEPFEEPVIVYHVGGAQTVPVRVGGKWDRQTHPGLVTIIPPATRIGWDIRGEVHSRSVHLGSRFFSAVEGVGSSTSSIRFRCGVQDPLLISAIAALESELRQPQQHGTLYADSVSDCMALHLLRECAGASIPKPNRRGGLSAPLLRRVLERLESCIETGVSLQALADEARLSRAYFSAAFRQATGSSAHRYLTQRRLARARELLRNTRLPLAEIALRCGFSSQAHFTEYFHREVGVTPSQFRHA